MTIYGDLRVGKKRVEGNGEKSSENLVYNLSCLLINDSGTLGRKLPSPAIFGT